MQKRRPLLITTGEPAGIGMDIVLLLAAEGKLQDFERPIWVTADSTAMTKRADELVVADVLKNPPIWQTIDIDADDFVSHGFGVLDTHMAETTTSDYREPGAGG